MEREWRRNRENVVRIIDGTDPQQQWRFQNGKLRFLLILPSMLVSLSKEEKA
jgi:hypothetical protein